MVLMCHLHVKISVPWPPSHVGTHIDVFLDPTRTETLILMPAQPAKKDDVDDAGRNGELMNHVDQNQQRS